MTTSWFLFFSYHNDALSNKHQIHKICYLYTDVNPVTCRTFHVHKDYVNIARPRFLNVVWDEREYHIISFKKLTSLFESLWSLLNQVPRVHNELLGEILKRVRPTFLLDIFKADLPNLQNVTS